MRMNELVSVVMAVYNTSETWLRKSIESILNQTYKEIEFIIVLDCPTDNSSDIVMEYAEADRRIIVLRNETNMGLVHSLNRGLAKAKGKYIARMDSDDIAFEDRIEKQLRYSTDQKMDILGARIIRIDEDDKEITGASKIYNSAQVAAILRYQDCVPHPTWFVRAEAYRKLCGYREVKSCEDYDLLLRAKYNGFRIGCHEEPLLYYRVNTAGITATNRLRQFLTACFLQNHYNRIEEVTPEQIEIYLKGKLSLEQSEKYERANNAIWDGIDLIKRNEITKGVKSIISSLFISKFSGLKLRSLLMTEKAFKQYASKER